MPSNDRRHSDSDAPRPRGVTGFLGALLDIALDLLALLFAFRSWPIVPLRGPHRDRPRAPQLKTRHHPAWGSLLLVFLIAILAVPAFLVYVLCNADSSTW